MKKTHLFYSAKQAEVVATYQDHKVFYQIEGKVVEITEAKTVEEGQATPSSNWDDAKYLGVGDFHHIEGKLTPIDDEY